MASKALARRASATATPRPLVFQVTVTEAIHPELYRALKGMSGRLRSMVVQSWADLGRVANLGTMFEALDQSEQRTDIEKIKGGDPRASAARRSAVPPRTYLDVAHVVDDLNLFDS